MWVRVGTILSYLSNTYEGFVPSVMRRENPEAYRKPTFWRVSVYRGNHTAGSLHKIG